MRIGILGSGPVGQTLGRGLAARGHDVKIGSRTPQKPELQEWLKATNGKASVGTFAEAAKHGEILALCCLGTAVDSVLQQAGPQNFRGKVLIDVTNPLDFSKGMPPSLFVGTTESLGERIQRKVPSTKVVKALNIVGNPTMVHPQMEEGLPTMLVAGNDAGAKKKVGALLRELGWEDPIDIGGIDGARWLEAFVPLWVRLAQEVGSWTVAIRVLRK